ARDRNAGGAAAAAIDERDAPAKTREVDRSGKAGRPRADDQAIQPALSRIHAHPPPRAISTPPARRATLAAIRVAVTSATRMSAGAGAWCVMVPNLLTIGSTSLRRFAKTTGAARLLKQDWQARPRRRRV